MPLRRFRSPPPKSPFGPAWEVPLWIDTLSDPRVMAEIRSVVLDMEKLLKRDIDPHPVAGINDGLTNRWQGFNIFAWPEPAMRAFQDFVRTAYLNYLQTLGIERRRCYVQGWANVVRSGEKFAPHTHDQSPFAYLSGNFTVACEATSTIYYPPYFYQGSPNPKASLPITNEPGLLTLFPSALLHETSMHNADSERITLAFDIFLQDYDLGGQRGPGAKHLVFDDPATSGGPGEPVLSRAS
jgi:hypothetical protein